MQLKKKKKKKKMTQQPESGAPDKCIFYCGTNAAVEILIR